MAVKKRAALFKKLLSGVCAAVCAVCMAGAALAQEPEAAPLPYRVEALPAGYSAVHEDGQILITDGQQTVGGVVGYPIPDGVYDPYDKWFDWLEDVGIPDYEDGELILDSAISDFRGGWHVNFQSPPGVFHLAAQRGLALWRSGTDRRHPHGHPGIRRK